MPNRSNHFCDFKFMHDAQSNVYRPNHRGQKTQLVNSGRVANSLREVRIKEKQKTPRVWGLSNPDIK